jgi:methylmalonyl-CoA mutase C-terminal domain/subunit
MVERKIRVLVAKPDLDGHDRGAKVVALALRDAGMEVAYSGLHQSIDQIVSTAIQESVDIIGLSIMTGAHLPICQKLIKRMQAEKMEDVRIIVGGVVPKDDVPKLKEMGVQGVFPGGTSFDKIVQSIQSLF